MNSLEEGTEISEQGTPALEEDFKDEKRQEAQHSRPLGKRTWIPLERPKKTSTAPGWTVYLLSVFSVSVLSGLVFFIASYRKEGSKIVLTKTKSFRISTQPSAVSNQLSVGRQEFLPEAHKKNIFTSFFSGKKAGVPTDSRARRPSGRSTGKWPMANSSSVRSGLPAPKQAAEKIPETSSQEAQHSRALVQKTIREDSILEKIRRDTKRIYVDKEISSGDLTFKILNVSEHGIELVVENKRDSVKTYYFPKVIAEENESIFEGTVLSPGSRVYGWLVIQNLREKKKIILEFSAVGWEKRKESVKLEW